MGSFDFANSAVGSLNSIFATVMGIAYPLILQAIERIDSQYNSTRLSRLFFTENTFKRYQYVLFLSIFLALTSVFLLQIVDGNVILTTFFVTLHSLVTYVLLYLIIQLVQLIIKYYDPLILIDRLKNKRGNIGDKHQDLLLESFDISKYAVLTDDVELFRKTQNSVYEVLNHFLSNHIKNHEGEEIDFTTEQKEYMNLLNNMVCKSEKNLFSSDQLLFSFWFSNWCLLLSINSTNYIWNFVTKVVEADNAEWFINYWSFADQYYRLTFERGRNTQLRNDDKVIKQQQKRFKEFHLALGAFLLYKEKYDLLGKIMFFSLTDPPSYSLIDNTLSAIFSHLECFDKKRRDNKLELKYPMSGMLKDAFTDSKVFNVICCYLTMLIYRLKIMHFNYSYEEPYALPSVEKIESTQDLQSADRLVNVLLNLFMDKNLQKQAKILHLYSKDSYKEGLSALKSCKDSIHTAMEKMYGQPEVDNYKISILKTNLGREAKNQKAAVVRKEDSELNDFQSSRKVLYCKTSFDLPKDMIYKKISKYSTGLEEAYISSLVSQEENSYYSYFIINRPVKRYVVRFKDIISVFGKMQIDKQYVILSLGIYLGTYSNIYGNHPQFKEEEHQMFFNDAKIIPLKSYMKSFVIMRKNDLPYVERMLFIPDDSTIKCIDEDSKLYSNADNLSPENRTLNLIWEIELVSKNDIPPFIMIQVEYNSNSSVHDLYNIESIDQLMGKA